MLGSSRALQGIVPDRLESLTDADGRPYQVFNFGLTAAGPLREWLTYQRLRAAGVRPAVVLVEVLAPCFNDAGPGRFAEEEVLRDVPLSAAEVLRLRPYLARPGRLENAWLRERLLPCLTQRRPITDWLLADWRPRPAAGQLTDRLDERGWQPFPVDAVDPAHRAQLLAAAERQYGTAFRDFRVGPGPMQALADLLADCRRDGARTLLVLMPESTTFRGWSAAANQELRRHLDALPDGERIDARAWMDDGDFWDTHHLFRRGAVAFSDRLAAEMARRLLAVR